MPITGADDDPATVWLWLCRFSASDVMLLGPEKVPAVRLYVFGESFMFNMIRHMVGMAVAVSRGALQLHHVPASLASCSLCTCTPPLTAARYFFPDASMLTARACSCLLLLCSLYVVCCMNETCTLCAGDRARAHAGCRWLLPTPWCCPTTRFATFGRRRRRSRRPSQRQGSR